MKAFYLLGAAVIALAGMAGVVPAQAEYPEKPVEFVVPFPPGDLEDVLTRIIAEAMQEETGVAAAVINKPGGGGGPFPGAAEVAVAPADGYTIGSFVIDVPVIGPKLGIDGITDDAFEPIGVFLTYPFVIAVKKDAPYQTMQELAEYAQDNKLVLGHFGYELLPTLATLVAAKQLGFEYGSDAAFDALDCNTLASGDADVINTTLQLIQPCLDDVTVLASVTDKPIDILDDVPTLGSISSDAAVSLWNGLFVPKGTPPEVKARIAEIAEAAIMGDKAQEIAAQTGAGVFWMNAEETAARIEADGAKVDAISEKLGL